jgi:hypothetical protein
MMTLSATFFGKHRRKVEQFRVQAFALFDFGTAYVGAGKTREAVSEKKTLNLSK